jgi:hypothetical protein
MGMNLTWTRKSIKSIPFILKNMTMTIATIIVIIVGPNAVLELAALGAADEQADRQGRSKASGRASGQQQTDERH